MAWLRKPGSRVLHIYDKYVPRGPRPDAPPGSGATPGDWRARAVLVAPCPLTGPPVLHLPGRTGWTRCGKPVTDEWATTTAVPDDPRHCRPCTRSER